MSNRNFAELSKSLRESEVADYGQAWAMPRSYYTDPAVFQLEISQLYGNEWICIGRSDEVAHDLEH